MRIISTNKKVLHNYEVIEKLTAGLIIKGYEVKSIKSGYVNITNAWVIINADGRAMLEGIDIPLYKKTSLQQVGNYEAKAGRQLLLTKHEITKLAERTHKTGNTMKVLDIFVGQKGLIKVTIGLVKLMRKIDKKQNLIEKDQIRDADREIRNLRL